MDFSSDDDDGSLDLDIEDTLSVDDILEMLKSNDSSLTTVDLRYKGLSGKRVTVLCEALKDNTHLRELKLDGNDEVSEHIEEFTRSLEVNSTLRRLYLRFTDIADEGGEALLNCLRIRKTPLTDLSVMGNRIKSLSLQEELKSLVAQDLDIAPEPEPSTNDSKHQKRRKRLKHSLPSSYSLLSLYTSQGIGALTGEDIKLKYSDDPDTCTLITMMKNEISLLKSQIGEISKKGESKHKSNPPVVVVDSGRIQINEKLAETGGSSASVFACIVDGWACAMKELDLQGVSETAIKGFETEIEVLEALPHHPNIIRYLFHQKKGTKLRLYMTRYATSLGKVIVERARQNGAEHFSSVEILKWCMDIATGLEFLKNHNIIHRDLKSDNIFVNYDSHKEINRLIIGDFDTAKRVSQTAGDLPKTIIGTPGYMAPEVINAQNGGSYSFKADVWSFGMVLFELMTLKSPYHDVDSFEVHSRILAGERPKLSDNLPSSYRGLIKLFEKCSCLNVDDRPDISAVKDELLTLQFEGE